MTPAGLGRSLRESLTRTAAPNQAVVSLTSVVVIVFGARALQPAQFGVFAGVQLVLLSAVGLVNAGILVPVTVDRSVDPSRPLAEVRRLMLWCGIGALAVAGGLVAVVDGDLRAAVLASGLSLPGALYWDAVRMHFLGRSAFLRALPGDLIAAGVTVAWVAVALEGHASLLVTLCGLGAGPAVAGLVMVPPWSRRWTSWGRPWPWRASRNMAVDYVISTGLDQLLTLLTAVFLSASALGGLRLAQTTMGPINTLALAMSMTVLPLMRDLDRTGAGKLWWATLRFGGVAALALLIGAALVVLPTPIGRSLLGPSWEIAAPVVLGVSVYAAASTLTRAASRTLITSGGSGVLVTTRLVTAPVVAALCLLVLMRHDLQLYVWTAALLAIASTTVLFVVAARSPGVAGADAAARPRPSIVGGPDGS